MASDPNLLVKVGRLDDRGAAGLMDPCLGEKEEKDTNNKIINTIESELDSLTNI